VQRHLEKVDLVAQLFTGPAKGCTVAGVPGRERDLRGPRQAELKRSRRRQPDPEELSRRFAGTVAQVVDKLGQHAKIGAWVYLHVLDPADHTAWR
jgi:alkanesulfonate monooxygenase SsuD/methylene tetrahydromethanopterin reductase-like flavin-dependent oxidoreductase (luciferase family)